MKQAMRLSLGALAFGLCVAAQATAPIISSLSKNGGRQFAATWHPAAWRRWNGRRRRRGRGQTNWAGLDAVPVGSNGMIQVSVPMFYSGAWAGGSTNDPSPAGMALIPAGSFTMGDTLRRGRERRAAHAHGVSVEAFYMDMN